MPSGATSSFVGVAKMLWARAIESVGDGDRAESGSANASQTRPDRRPGLCDAAPSERQEVLVEGLGWRLVAEGLAGAAVERGRDGVELGRRVLAEVGAFREVLAQQAVGVLVGAALPGALRVAEVDGQPGVDAQLRVLGHLGALVPGQRATKLFWKGRDRGRDRVADGLGPVPGQRGTVMDPGMAMALHAGQVQQHREAGAALDQRPDRRAAQPEDEIAFPVTRHGPIGGFGRALADQELRTDELLA